MLVYQIPIDSAEKLFKWHLEPLIISAICIDMLLLVCSTVEVHVSIGNNTEALYHTFGVLVLQSNIGVVNCS